MGFLTSFEGKQAIGQLEKNKGGYFYLMIEAEIVNQFEKKRHTRFLCHLDEKTCYPCGLNHLGNGHYFIIVAGKYLEQLGKKPGDLVCFKIEKDPNPLGVDIPEVLQVLLAQDEDLNETFKKITDGKKRALIYSILKTKDIDKQVKTAMGFLAKEKQKFINKGSL